MCRSGGSLRLAHVLASALLALPAQAELVEIDLLAPGDGLITRDTETGLDWLDLDGVTTGLSYDAIQGGAGGWLASGWRYATEAEVCHLFVEHTPATTCNEIQAFSPAPPSVPLLSFLEPTYTSLDGSTYLLSLSGLYDDGTPGEAGEAGVDLGARPIISGLEGLLRTHANPDAVPASRASAAGSFLVRATPPEIPALPLAGVAAFAASLAFAARRALAS